MTAALNYEQNKTHQEGISKIKPFINKCDRKEIDFPTQQKDWKKSELNNDLFVPYNTGKNKSYMQLKI